jgi:hypothetical protein
MELIFPEIGEAGRPSYSHFPPESFPILRGSDVSSGQLRPEGQGKKSGPKEENCDEFPHQSPPFQLYF